MAFASEPKLVIADEPTTALDVTIQARIVRLIAEMQERDDTAVVFITHDLRLAAQVCDDILVLYAGRAAEYGPARKVFAAPGHPYTRCLQLANPAMSGARRGALCAARAHAGPARLPRRCPAAPSRRAARASIEDAAQRVPPFVEIGAGHVGGLHPHRRARRRSRRPRCAPADEPARERADPRSVGLSKRFVSGGLFRRADVRGRQAMSASRCTRTSSSASSARAAAARARWRG